MKELDDDNTNTNKPMVIDHEAQMKQFLQG